MPDYRAPRDYLFGTLLNNAAVSDTSLVSTAFTSLPTTYSSNYVLPLTLHDPVAEVYEVVWVTGHAAASNTVTVLRARENTTARSWPASTQIVCAPTLRDGLLATNRSGLPSDRHTGVRAVVTDEGIVLQSTWGQGWQADVGVAVPGEFGLRLNGSAISNARVIIARGGRVSGTTDANGRITATYLTPFPIETLRVIPTLVSTSDGTVVISVDSNVAPTASGFTCYFYKPGTNTGAGAGVNITFDYIALGI